MFDDRNPLDHVIAAQKRLRDWVDMKEHPGPRTALGRETNQSDLRLVASARLRDYNQAQELRDDRLALLAAQIAIVEALRAAWGACPAISPTTFASLVSAAVADLLGGR